MRNFPIVEQVISKTIIPSRITSGYIKYDWVQIEANMVVRFTVVWTPIAPTLSTSAKHYQAIDLQRYVLCPQTPSNFGPPPLFLIHTCTSWPSTRFRAKIRMQNALTARWFGEEKEYIFYSPYTSMSSSLLSSSLNTHNYIWITSKKPYSVFVVVAFLARHLWISWIAAYAGGHHT